MSGFPSKELFLFWPNHEVSEEVRERPGPPCITAVRDYAQRYADNGALVIEYSLVGPLAPKEKENEHQVQ